MSSRTLTELTSAVAATTWIPTEHFADLILEAAVCYGQLSGVITAVDYNLSAGMGDTVNVRTISARTAQAIDDCLCASAVSSTLSSYTLDINKVMDADKICGMAIFDAGEKLKGSILNEMAKGLAAYRDAQIWADISMVKPGGAGVGQYAITPVGCLSTVTHFTGAFKYNLYDSIVSLKQAMLGRCYNPDYVIMHPTVARWLYIKDYVASMAGLITYSPEGKALTIAGLKIIESGQATAANSTSYVTMAVVIDSSRAVGEAWGKRPTFTEAYDVLCDAYTEAVVMYWGHKQMDKLAIAHVRNGPV